MIDTLALALPLLAASLLGALWITLRSVRSASRSRMQLSVNTQLLDEAVAQMGAQVAEIARLSAMAAQEYDIRVKTVESIAIIERDRNTWRDKYWHAGLGHSAAQEMLMREIIRLAAALKRNGSKITANPACGQLVEKFKADHVADLPPEASNRIADGSVQNAETPVDPTAQ